MAIAGQIRGPSMLSVLALILAVAISTEDARRLQVFNLYPLQFASGNLSGP